MTLFELSSCGCSVELVLPLQMIMKVVRGHLKHVNIFIHAQCLVKVIIGKNILVSMVLMLEEIEHTISGILRVPFHKEEDLYSREDFILNEPHKKPNNNFIFILSSTVVGYVCYRPETSKLMKPLPTRAIPLFLFLFQGSQNGSCNGQVA